jgi:cytoplasmic iron level regulating protein YaaA (DUF328/UPF0246 family)
VIILLPPSETKAHGGTGLTIAELALTFGALNPARDRVITALRQPELVHAPTLPAIDRYSGTLYSAIHGRGLKGSPTADNRLTDFELARANEILLIQSALFGLISPLDRIPNYKISPSKKLGELSLKTLWSEAHLKVWPRLVDGPIIDLRSKAYAELAPVPEELNPYSVVVYVEKADGSLEQLNHFNKKAKGQLVRAALLATKLPGTLEELVDAAASADLRLEHSNKQLVLVTKQAT